MKISTLFIKIYLLLSFLIITSCEIKAQDNFSIGAYLGSGYITGNSPSLTSLNTQVFIQLKTFFPDIFFTRISFIYNRDIDYYFGTRNDYYPFIKGVSLKAITYQDLEGNLFLEEGFGFLYINDRTFSDTNSDDFGTAFSFAGGLDMRRFSSLNVKLGLGLEYGLTFNKTLADYLSIYLQGEYIF